MKKEIAYKSKALPLDQGLLVSQYFINAFDDYIAARLLLLNSLLPQGCILATTAIEKYFKGLLISQGIVSPKHHDIAVKSFRNSLKNKFKKIYDLINWEFISFLSKTYKLRYLDDIEKEYSIAIIKVKTLAELDFIVCTIEDNFMIVNPKSEARENKYRYMKNNKIPSLVGYNFHLLGLEKTPFVQQIDDIYEFRKLTNGEVIEVRYKTEKILNDGKFLYDAFKPKVTWSRFTAHKIPLTLHKDGKKDIKKETSEV